MSAFAEAGAALIGGTLASCHLMAGGDLTPPTLILLEDGREAVVKGGPAPRLEAHMLRKIAENSVPAPAVLGVTDELLVMERLPENGTPGRAGPSLAEAVRALHAIEGPLYGWPEDYAFGPVSIENRGSENWVSFWVERRLLVHAAHVPPDIARRVHRLAGRLGDLLPAKPFPSLLHGDLWSGNVVVDGDRISGLIDPACYFGHAEVDLAMLTLFGGPGRAFFEAYGQLEPGFEERRTIYQLWPALVHLRLFGSGYREMVENLLGGAGA